MAKANQVSLPYVDPSVQHVGVTKLRALNVAQLHFSFSLGAVVQIGRELRAAALAHSREVRRGFHDTESAHCHDPSLLRALAPVDFNRHHSPRADNR